MKKYAILSIVVIFCLLLPLNLSAQSKRVTAGYLIDLVNPERKLFGVRADFDFPTPMDSVVFTIDETDNHYTESYSEYISLVKLYTLDSVEVPLTPIGNNGWVARKISGKYFMRYFVAIEHPLKMSQYGFDETPYFHGTRGILIGTAFIIYPMLESPDKPVDIKLKFDLSEGAIAALPNKRIGPNEYIAPGYDHIMNAYWAVGTFDTLMIGDENYPLRVAVQRNAFKFSQEHLIGNIRGIWEDLCDVFKFPPEFQPLLIVSEFPFVENMPQMYNAGAASPGSINIMLDPKLTEDELDQNSGLIVYNLFTQWLPITFFPENRIGFSWLIRGGANYYQLKLMAQLGLISEKEFLDRIASIYDYYSREFDQRQISVRAARELPNAQGYIQNAEILTAAMMDMRLVAYSSMPCSLDALLAALVRRYNGKTNTFTSEQFYELADTLSGLFLRPVLDSCINYNYKIELPAQLRVFGINLENVKNAQPDIGIQLAGFTNLTVEDVRRGGPAFNAGLEIGDKIVKLDGKPFNNINSVINHILQKKIGSKIKVDYERRGKSYSTSIQVGGIDKYEISFMKNRTAEQVRLWNRYLGK